jgi:hypothetical protein
MPIVMTFITGQGLVLHFRHARSNQGQRKTLVRLYASSCHFILSKLMMYAQAANFGPDSYSIRCKSDLLLRAAAHLPVGQKWWSFCQSWLFLFGRHFDRHVSIQ